MVQGKRLEAEGGGTIAHVVLLIKENHTFDNYFGASPGANGVRLAHSANPPPQDPNHQHGAWLTRETTAVRQQFVEADIPAYFAFGRQYTLCDNYFTDVAGPSTPNHLMLIAAASPIIANPPHHHAPASAPLFTLPSLPRALERAKLTWRNYGGYAFALIAELHGRPTLVSDQFAKDAAAGNLPAVAWVYAPHDASEHPPDPSDRGNSLVGNVTHGMQWTVDQVKAVVQGGLWPQTAIFITWDDWGGWYDHVAPPDVETWKADRTQFRYGSRVGCLVSSPFAKQGYVSKTLHSHVSLLRFCEARFGLPAMNARDRNADDMSDCFDFSQRPAPPPRV